MDYLVELALADSSRPRSLEEGRVLAEQFIVPSLRLLMKYQAEGKVVAGGPVSATIAIVLIVRAESAQELDEIVESLPVWSRMTTKVTPLTTFDGRITALAKMKERLSS